MYQSFKNLCADPRGPAQLVKPRELIPKPMPPKRLLVSSGMQPGPGCQ